MARRPKTVYERINGKMAEIAAVKEKLDKLYKELDDLKAEQDELEMRALLEQMKSQGLTISQAIELMNKQ